MWEGTRQNEEKGNVMCKRRINELFEEIIKMLHFSFNI